MTAVFIILALMSVPLAAIASKTYVKKRELDAKGSSALVREVELLRAETRELRERVETLETIATGASALPAASAEALSELELAARRARAG